MEFWPAPRARRAGSAASAPSAPMTPSIRRRVINVRAMAYDFARAIVASARRRNVGAFIFELARSENLEIHSVIQIVAVVGNLVSKISDLRFE